jgi:hypothetical protein
LSLQIDFLTGPQGYYQLIAKPELILALAAFMLSIAAIQAMVTHDVGNITTSLAMAGFPSRLILYCSRNMQAS